jgi:hypothetical protein
MTESHKYKINKNRSEFHKNLQVTNTLLNILSEDYTLTREMREEIEVILKFLFHFVDC